MAMLGNRQLACEVAGLRLESMNFALETDQMCLFKNFGQEILEQKASLGLVGNLDLIEEGT